MTVEPDQGSDAPNDFVLRGEAGPHGQKTPKKAAPRPRAKLGVAVLLLAGTGLLGYAILGNSAGSHSPMKTSTANSLAQVAAGADVGHIALPASAARATLPTTMPQVQPAQPILSSMSNDGGLAAEITALKAQVQSLQGAKPDAHGVKDQIEHLQAQVQKMQAANAADIAALSAELKASQLSGQDRSAVAADAKTKAEAAAVLQARIASKSVVYDGGQSASTTSASTVGGVTGVGSNMADGRIGLGGSTPSADARGRSFVKDAQSAPPIEHATKIADPGHTVLQGTVIQATLETGVNSNLPGQLVAVVSYPVYSFDQTRILIPAGSKLFGNYSSDVGLGQARVLVGWTRLVTPAGQSVNMKAFGADDQGVSGVGGQVHSRFGLKFGSAALISLIATAPQVVASKATNQSATTAVQSVGQDLSGATQSAIGAYVTLPNVITIDPGTAVSVIVDRDLGIY